MNTNIVLKAGNEDSSARKHPWIFSGAIAQRPELPDGTLVRVEGAKGQFIAWGYWGHASIAVRILSWEDRKPDLDWWVQAIGRAYTYRQSLGFTSDNDSDSFRLIHGEGDGIPGLVCDYYNGTVVVQYHNEGIESFEKEIDAALHAVLGNSLKRIVHRNTKHKSEGNLLDIIQENGVKYEIDFLQGQKTGFFLDQRLNRLLLRQYVKDKKVLNTFCYTGGFSFAALKGGASKVVSVDSSKFALQLLERNLEINHFDKSKHQSVLADAVRYIRSVSDDFDVIILDPPAFAKSLKARHNAIQAYKRINAAAMKAIKTGGYLFTFSCSQVVDYELFSKTVYSAAIESGRNLRIVHRLEQSPDHPTSIYHPEGEYLKGLVLYIE